MTVINDDISVVQERYTPAYGLDSDVTPPIPMAGQLGWTGTAWEKVETDGFGSLKVGVNALPIGTNNIGDVDVASLPSGSLGQQLAATSLSVVPGTNIADATYIGDIKFGENLPGGTIDTVTTITNTVHVDDNSSTLSVDDGASSLTVDNATISVVGSGIEATAQRVTIATDSTGVLSVDDNGGSLTTDIGTALPAGTNIIGAVKRDVINYTPITKYYTNAGAVTDGIVWSPSAGKKWVITDMILSISAAATITLEEDLAAGDSVRIKYELAANGGVSTNFQTPLHGTEDDADLLITTSAGNIYITVTGYEID